MASQPLRCADISSRQTFTDSASRNLDAADGEQRHPEQVNGVRGSYKTLNTADGGPWLWHSGRRARGGHPDRAARPRLRQPLPAGPGAVGNCVNFHVSDLGFLWVVLHDQARPRLRPPVPARQGGVNWRTLLCSISSSPSMRGAAVPKCGECPSGCMFQWQSRDKPESVCQAVPALRAGALWCGRPAAGSPRREHAAGGHAPPGRICLLHVPDGGAGECLGAHRCRVKAHLHSLECTPSFVIEALPLVCEAKCPMQPTTAAKYMCHG